MAANNVPVYRETHDVEIAAMYAFYKRPSNSLHNHQTPWNLNAIKPQQLASNVGSLQIDSTTIMSININQQTEQQLLTWMP
jgi:hypothetical protein